MKLGKQLVSIKILMRRNWMDTEMRVRMNDLKAQQYAAEMADGCTFPVPVVFVDHEEYFHVGDGFHRIFAHAINGESEVEIDLKVGGYREAFLWNITANKNLGLPFTHGDKRRCIMTMFRDKVTGKWTQAKIADTVGCTPAYVSKIAKDYTTGGSKLPSVIVDSAGRAKKRPVMVSRPEVIERKQRALAMYSSGEHISDIVDKLKVPSHTAYRYIREAIKDEHMVECPHCKGTGLVRAKEPT